MVVSAFSLPPCSSLGLRDGIGRAAWRGGCGSPEPFQREQGLSKPIPASPAPSSMRLQGAHGNVQHFGKAAKKQVSQTAELQLGIAIRFVNRKVK